MFIYLFILLKNQRGILFGSSLNGKFISRVINLLGICILNEFNHHEVSSSWKNMSNLKKKRSLCLGIIQKPLLISSLVMNYCRKASAFFYVGNTL